MSNKKVRSKIQRAEADIKKQLKTGIPLLFLLRLYNVIYPCLLKEGLFKVHQLSCADVNNAYVDDAVQVYAPHF